jgi:hypothetical protein
MRARGELVRSPLYGFHLLNDFPPPSFITS